MPKAIWEKIIKPSWDGSDGSVKEILGRGFKFVRKPLYYVMRPWREETTAPMLAKMRLLERLKVADDKSQVRRLRS